MRLGGKVISPLFRNLAQRYDRATCLRMYRIGESVLLCSDSVVGGVSAQLIARRLIMLFRLDRTREISVTGETRLLLMPAVGIWKVGEDFFLDRKFFDGFMAYIAAWPGPIDLVMRLAKSSPPSFGLVRYIKSTFPSNLRIMVDGENLTQDDLSGVSLVMASADDYRNFYISKLCKKTDVPCVFDIEYIFETRCQITKIESQSLLARWKTYLWLAKSELQRVLAFASADGLQANGVPAFNAYRRLVAHSMLYFDSRCSEVMAISKEALAARTARLMSGAPLHLAFSGRLISIKGADDLVDIALHLKRLGVDFKMSIFGAGELDVGMRRQIIECELSSQVFMHGAVDFKDELIPALQQNIDLFICCHRQSDPSCTYLETYAQGVPIIGYSNRAHCGILAIDDLGWAISIGDKKGLAEKIALLNQDRESIVEKSYRAIKFSRQHFFENTFAARMGHCADVLKRRHVVSN